MMQPVDDTRRENLRIAIRDHFPSARQLALRIGVHPNSISRVFSDSPRDRRNVGDEMARAIEREAGLPTGWMDTDHRAGSQEDILAFLGLVSQMSNEELEELIERVSGVVSPESAMRLARIFFDRAGEGL